MIDLPLFYLILAVKYVCFIHLVIQRSSVGSQRQFEGQVSQNMIIQQIKLVTGVIPPIYGIIDEWRSFQGENNKI